MSNRLAAVVWRPFLRVAAAAVALAVTLAGPGPIWAANTQPYSAREFAVARGERVEQGPRLSSSRVIWRRAGEERRIYGRDLSTGHNFSFATQGRIVDYDLDGDLVVTIEAAGDRKGVFAYRLDRDFARSIIAPLRGGKDFQRLQVRIQGHTVVWAEGTDPDRALDIYAYDTGSGATRAICANPALQEWPAVSRNVVVWADRRNAKGQGRAVHDLYGYDLAASREFRITAGAEAIGAPAIAGNIVAWPALHDGKWRIMIHDMATGERHVVARLGGDPGNVRVDVGGELVVWNAHLSTSGDQDVYGYDLGRGRQFTISRAIGDQTGPRIAGRTVVWADTRHRSLEAGDRQCDLYGATLKLEESPVPPVIGAPEAVDARIQIVWPHNGAPVSEANKANVGAYVVRRGTLRPAPCQWHPRVYLWRSINNGPASIVAGGTRQEHGFLWEFNDIDVSPARDPRNRVYFLVTVVGAPSRTSVWAHAADARTYFPQQDKPSGTRALGSAVDAKIEIVWPHGNAPVREARLANITAALFQPATLYSVPQDTRLTVRLWKAVNNGVGQPVGVGERRVVTRNGVTFPLWDFNNVDVSAARDPARRIYFFLTVDGWETHTNVWVHGADARTYFPHQDQLEGGCS